MEELNKERQFCVSSYGPLWPLFYSHVHQKLLSAAESGNTDEVVACLQRGADINYKDIDGRTALHRAARNGHDRSVEILVEGGGDINVQDYRGRTALHLAAWGGHDRIVGILVEGGGDINVPDNEGWTALHWAAGGGHDRIVEILVEGGGDINVQNREGQTALHGAALYGHDRMVKILVEGGGDINVKNDEGWTALHDAALAAGGGHDRIIEILVEGGGDINVQDNRGWTALHEAAVNGHDRSVEVLVEGGGDINVQDNEGSTPLHKAVKKETWHDADDMERKERTAALLVQLGANMSLTNNKGKTPLDYCKRNTKRSLQGLASQVMTAFPRIADGKEFQNLLSKGFYFSYNNRVYLAGACNVGKSTLASILIGVKISKDWISTDGLKIYFGKNGIDLKKKEMVVISKALQDNILASILVGEPSLDPTPAVRNRSLIESLKLLFKKRPQKSIQTQPSKIASPQVLPKAMQSSQDIPKIDPSHSEYQHSLMEPEQHQEDLIHHKPSYKQSHAVIQKNLTDEIRRGKYKVSIAPSDLVDFGGQKAFDLTHQLFIQQKGAFVLLIDGRKHLDDALPEYQDGKMTTRMILLHWVNSILTYCTADNDDIYPLIVFAVTHKDELTKEAQHTKFQEVTAQLTDMFNGHEYCDRIKFQQLFLINATDNNDSGVLSLKQYLVHAAFQQKSWGEKMPMAWVPLELQISEMRSNDIFIISFDELYRINRSNDDLSLSAEQFQHFLRCQHSLGKLMHFDIPVLNKYVIVQPTAMVDILRSFITDEIFWPKESILRSILSTASSSGILKKCDLFKIWLQDEFNIYVPTDEIKEYITLVLSHLDILVPPKRYNEPAEKLIDAFLVPCMIRQSIPSTQTPDNLDNDKTIFLSYRLLKSAVPNALAYKLIGVVLNIWPLKRKDGRLCLFDKAAVFEIDQTNDLHFTFKDNRFIVALSNTKSKNHISPDVSSIIQECLSLTIEKVLEFYFTSAGKCGSKIDVSTLFETEVGDRCGEELCFTALTTEGTSWICEHQIEHNLRFLSYWSFDQKQEMCVESCTGLFTDCLDGIPEDKHLIRLAKRVVKKFYDFIIHLGLTTDKWEDIENNTTYPDRLTKRFIALCECKNQRRTFRDFAKALTDSECSEHFLCQVFMEGCKEVLDNATVNLQESPEDNVLEELSEQIGNCAMPLGVELGLQLPIIEHIIYAYIKNMFGQNLGVLCEWKKRSNNPTIMFPMKALHQADKRGLNFLIEKYK